MTRRRGKAQGSVAVEFAIVITMFLSMVLGAMDLARWLYTIDAASEAARAGARVAVVCNLNSSAINAHIAVGLAMASGGTTTISYQPTGCFAQQAQGNPACTGATVSLTGYTVPRVAWFLPTMTVPTIRTYLSRESMDSTNNARCS